jgi:hypothetical protein
MPSLDAWNEINDELKALSTTELKNKKTAQKKMLGIIKAHPEYQSVRFQLGFENLNDFVQYISERREGEELYGSITQDIPLSSFFSTEEKQRERVLEETKKKNKAQQMGSFQLPGTDIQLINYAPCPQCASIYSFKDLCSYYIKQRMDPQFKGMQDQQVSDTRMLCEKCNTFFFPSLLVMDGSFVKNEVQFLSRLQTMNYIESAYEAKDIKVLSKDIKNLVKKDGFRTRAIMEGKEEIKIEFLSDMFLSLVPPPPEKKILKGINNDVLIKEIEEKPTLIINLLQYTPTNIALELVDGSNATKESVLFGSWQ